MNNQMKSIYAQLAESIKIKIINGTFKVGDKIPSEREMAATYQITRVTVRRAINSLIEEGVLKANKGSGTYVASVPEDFRRITLGEGSSSRLTQDIARGGMQAARKVISLKKIENKEYFSYFPDEKHLVELVRLMYVDKIPYALQIAYIPYSLFPEAVEMDFDENSLYDYMESKGHRPVKIPSELCIVNIEEDYRKYLECEKDKKVFYFRYVGYDKNDKVVELTKSYNLPEHTEYRFIIKRF